MIHAAARLSAPLPPCSTEALADAFSRLDMMSRDRGETWDLSPNDQHAIALVLAQARGQLKLLCSPSLPESVVEILVSSEEWLSGGGHTRIDQECATSELEAAVGAWIAAGRPGLEKP